MLNNKEEEMLYHLLNSCTIEEAEQLLETMTARLVERKELVRKVRVARRKRYLPTRHENDDPTMGTHFCVDCGTERGFLIIFGGRRCETCYDKLQDKVVDMLEAEANEKVDQTD